MEKQCASDNQKQQCLSTTRLGGSKTCRVLLALVVITTTTPKTNQCLVGGSARPRPRATTNSDNLPLRSVDVYTTRVRGNKLQRLPLPCTWVGLSCVTTYHLCALLLKQSSYLVREQQCLVGLRSLVLFTLLLLKQRRARVPLPMYMGREKQLCTYANRGLDVALLLSCVHKNSNVPTNALACDAQSAS
jgi:hypothetical protein